MSEPTQVPPVAGDGDLLQRFNGRLYELTKPAKLPPKWRFIRPAEFIRQCPRGDTAALVAKLTQDFTPAELNAVGATVATDNADSEPSPLLRSPLYFSNEGGEAFNVETADGPLCNALPSVIRLGQSRSERSVSDRKYYLVAARDTDACALAANGLLALPGKILSQLSMDDALQMFAGPEFHYHYEFVLCGWDAAGLRRDVPDEVIAIAERFQKLQLVQELVLDRRLKVWIPTEAELAQLQAAVEVRAVGHLKQIITGSINSSQHSLADVLYQHTQRQPVDLVTLYQTLQWEIQRTKKLGSSVWVKVALDKLRAEYARAFGDVFGEAMSSSNVLDKARSATLAGLMMARFEDIPEVRAARQVIAGDIHAEPAIPDAADRAETMQVLKLLATLSKSDFRRPTKTEG